MNKKILPAFLLISSFSIPLLIYIILSLYLKAWIIDDAGISFVYSRSLADGYGLVTQPGAERVEGYSNFLWVLIYTPFFLFNCFDPYITPKILSCICVGFMFYLITKICIQRKRPPVQGLFINLLIAINTPFIIWTSSGLENPLYVLLITLLIYISLQYSELKKNKLILTGAIITFLISITRPDGILFAILFPFAIFSSGVSVKKMIKPVLMYAVLICSFLGGLLLFRWLYFHDVLPNTYYAKTGNTGELIEYLLTRKNAFSKKYHSVFLSMGGFDFIYVIYGIFGLLLLQLFVFRKKIQFNLVLPMAFIISFLIYMLLPYDWMGNYRFATPFIVITHICFGLIVMQTVQLLPKFKTLVIGLLLVFFGIYSWISYKDHHKRLIVFYKLPAAPFGAVKAYYADGFNRYADLLHITNGSLLLPDVGATYYYSNLRVYDSAGLCDRTIAKSKHAKNRQRMHDYIFKEIKPTFIHLHEGWSEMIRPDEYNDFRNDYIPIFESLAEDMTNYTGVNIYSGDYVRRDAINDANREALEKIMAERN